MGIGAGPTKKHRLGNTVVGENWPLCLLRIVSLSRRVGEPCVPQTRKKKARIGKRTQNSLTCTLFAR
jgi:hypothetical protein